MVTKYDFNPRSHERSDDRYAQLTFNNDISIHAPTRGATKNVLKSPVKALISIHAPTRGATLSLHWMSINLNISIHAPTRGATIQHLKAYANTVFQSTLPREERRSREESWRVGSNFNPRSHERSDDYLLRSCPIHWYFNPRSHERSDKAKSFVASSTTISIHAPTRGATHIVQCLPYACFYFNPRSHERSDSNIAQKICLFLYNTDNKYIIR